MNKLIDKVNAFNKTLNQIKKWAEEMEMTPDSADQISLMGSALTTSVQKHAEITTIMVKKMIEYQQSERERLGFDKLVELAEQEDESSLNNILRHLFGKGGNNGKQD